MTSSKFQVGEFFFCQFHCVLIRRATFLHRQSYNCVQRSQAWRYLSHFSWFSSSSFHPTLYVSCEFKATKQDVLQSYQTGGNLALQVLQHKSPSRRVIVTFMDLSPTFEVWHLGLRDGCKLLPRWWPMPHWSNSAAWTWCQTNYQPDQIFMSESFKNAFNEVGHAK